MKTIPALFLSAAALAASATLSIAQDNEANPPGRGERGDRRGNPEEFRQRMGERLKAALKVSDEEWAVMQPLLEKIQAKQRDSMGGRGGGRGPGGPRPEGAPDGERPPRGDRPEGGDRGPRGDRGGSPESQALRTALENEATSADDLKAKLTAVREQRKKAAAELAAARADLQKIVSVRQEATLVAMGILE